MDILIINPLIVLNSVMINYELFRRNFDSERLPYTITELLLRQLLLRRASYWSVDIESLSVASSSSWLSCRYYIVITLLVFWVNSSNHYNTKNTGVQIIKDNTRSDNIPVSVSLECVYIASHN